MRLCWECLIYQDEVIICIRQIGKDDYTSEWVMVNFNWARWLYDDENRTEATYSCEIKFKYIDQLNGAALAARKIIKKVDQMLCGFKPIDVINALVAIKAVEVLYDGRAGGYVPLENVLPAEYKCWYDRLEIEGGYGKYKSICKKEADAQADIIAQAASANDLDWVNRFIEAGMPVEVSGGIFAVDATPAIERLGREGLDGIH